ncbi:uncharacterized protein LOC130797154 [Amaranthus tricolor]|uniref:uncharacterized protein LOC130797154 n=1 Tax=Amaranthus tricolor TaxID=29722 RepID=UPI002585CF48|nr:uncharacterized protein LOC130797154 [Amaranthus tricolor]
MSCFKGISLMLSYANPRTKLISYEGTTKIIKGRIKIKAGEIMFKYPDCVICHADSFYLGRPIPVLAIHDNLVAGRTYFILPLDRLPCGSGLLSAATLQSLSAAHSPNCSPNISLFSGGNESPFDYIKDKDGRVIMIKVVPEFIAKIINGNNSDNNHPIYNSLCTTPELKKEYEHLVRAKDQTWSPKLETISEVKIRASPTSKLLRLEWKTNNKKFIN